MRAGLVYDLNLAARYVAAKEVCRCCRLVVERYGTLRLSTFVFFFNDTATTEIYPLPLPDALPICFDKFRGIERLRKITAETSRKGPVLIFLRSEEHTSELQSHSFISYAVFCL